MSRLFGWDLPPGCSIRDLPGYDDDTPPFYKQEGGIVKRGRKCTRCNRTMPPGTRYKRLIIRDYGEPLKYEQTCEDYEVPCSMDWKMCPDCDHGLLHNEVDEEGYPKACPTCGGKGRLRLQASHWEHDQWMVRVYTQLQIAIRVNWKPSFTTAANLERKAKEALYNL